MGGSESAGSASFAVRAAHLQRRLARGGVRIADMRGAPALELQFAGGVGGVAPVASARPGIEPIEGGIVARRVPPAAAASSRIRYFLDGAQRTLPFARIGSVPVAAVVAGAGVLEREPCAGCAMAPGTIAFRHALIVPRRLPDPEVQRMVEMAAGLGWDIVDPLDVPKVTDPEAVANDYGQMQYWVFEAAKGVRESLERDVLLRFRGPDDRSREDGWLVVDGRLSADRPRTLGLVKRFTNAYLSGAEANVLLSLPKGHRTTAFRASGGRHYGEALENRLLWYLRMWDHDGLDAHHSLVRVEATPDVESTTQIDEISGWLLAERTPRATGDERWATLLYPVHQLERILKRRIDGDTRGWSGR